MKRFGISAGLVAVSAAVLVACGSGDTVPVVQLVAADFTANAAPANTAGLVGVSLTAPTGVPALGTTAATTIAIGGTAAAQTAKVTEGANTADGRWTYGSCIFTITASTFPSSHPLALGKTVTIEPCTVSVNTTNMVADAPATNRTLTVNFGGRPATAVVPVIVNSNGTLTVNGGSAGTVTLRPSTGG